MTWQRMRAFTQPASPHSLKQFEITVCIEPQSLPINHQASAHKGSVASVSWLCTKVSWERRRRDPMIRDRSLQVQTVKTVHYLYPYSSHQRLELCGKIVCAELCLHWYVTDKHSHTVTMNLTLTLSFMVKYPSVANKQCPSPCPLRRSALLGRRHRSARAACPRGGTRGRGGCRGR